MVRRRASLKSGIFDADRHLASAPGDREAWIEAKRDKGFMVAYRLAGRYPPIVLLLVAGLLYGFVDHFWLALWTAAMALLNLHRFWQTRQFFLGEDSHADGLSDHGALLVKSVQKWALAAPLGWGLLTFLYYGRVEPEVQFLCLVVFLGIGGVAVSIIAPFWVRHNSYFTAMAVPGIAAICSFHVLPWAYGTPFRLADLAMPTFAVLYWVILRAAGARALTAHTHTLSLQYEREQLIGELAKRSFDLTAASASRARLLAGAAHDLRQPVHALNLYADWLRSEPELSVELTPKIVACTAAINALFNSLFEFARVDHGPTQLTLKPLSMCELVQDMKTQYAPVAHSKGLEFRVRINPGHVLADDVTLKRILGNLLDNAIKYTEHGGVLLTCRRRGSKYRIDVWDTGVGIAPEYGAQVFEEFFRVQDNPGTRDSFGLGLAIVQRLAARLKSVVTFSSQPGRGSRFGFVIDACAPDAQAVTLKVRDAARAIL